ncbi:hypothetical protein Krac_6860 [Ktedonobacter racemifer DSM 44963]|uniref:Uncharacterized protein n=1 Tax=Ktedonobacter racemifer DSM 44963 TaxID=485913 RepID=D6TPL9_KTERA|nr:hypothetical protein Krac_6860 [Ktedonobacter racemifer DSM 44963]
MTRTGETSGPLCVWSKNCVLLLPHFELVFRDRGGTCNARCLLL